MKEKIIVHLSTIAATVALLITLFACTSADPIDIIHAAQIYVNQITATQLHSDQITAEHITLGGAPLLIPACGEMYITALVATPLALANVYYKSLGTTTPGEERGFTSLDAGRMTYNDITPDRLCLITGVMALRSDTVNNVISAKLYVNDLPHESSIVKTKLLLIGDMDVLSIVALATLQPGDYIEVWLASDKAGVTITLEGLDFTATTVD